MKKIFIIAMLPVILFCSYSCLSAERQTGTLKEELCRGILQHFNEKNYDKAGEFTSFVGRIDDLVEFKENGDVLLRLSKDNQVFDITKKQQQHRLRGLTNLIREAK